MSEREPGLPEHYRVRALEQALGVLELLAERPELTIPEITEHLGLQVPNAHKLIVHLQEAGLVETGVISRRYRLGARRLGELTTKALAGLSPWEVLRESVPRLQETAGTPGLIAVLVGGRAIYVEQFRGPARALGRAFPAHATALGKALLAALPPTAEAAVLSELVLDAWTPRTLVDSGALAAELAATRERGYAIEDGELDLRRRSVGMVVRDHTGAAMAAIGVGGFASDLPDDRILEVAGAVSAEARRISQALGAGPLIELPPRRLEVEVTGAVEPPAPAATSEGRGSQTKGRAARPRASRG